MKDDGYVWRHKKSFVFSSGTEFGDGRVVFPKGSAHHAPCGRVPAVCCRLSTKQELSFIQLQQRLRQWQQPLGKLEGGGLYFTGFFEPETSDQTTRDTLNRFGCLWFLTVDQISILRFDRAFGATPGGSWSIFTQGLASFCSQRCGINASYWHQSFQGPQKAPTSKTGKSKRHHASTRRAFCHHWGKTTCRK